MSAPSRTWAARSAASLALAAVPMHVVMFAMGHHDPVITTLMVVMTGWCALCALHVWRSGRRFHRSSVVHLWAMAVTMAVLHGALLAGPPGLTGGHHGHGAAAGHGEGGWLMVGIIALELTVAVVCAVALRRTPLSTAPAGQLSPP